MADTIVDKVLTGEWQDAYALSGIAAGTSLLIQNKGSNNIQVFVGATAPASTVVNDGVALVCDEQGILDASQSGCWLLGTKGQLVSIQENSNFRLSAASSVAGGGGGGGGDASSANQLTEIARLTTLVSQTDSVEGALASLDGKTPALSGGKVPVVATAVSGTLTNRSGTITAGGTAQQVAAANAARIGFSVQNLSTGDLWINTLGTAAAAQPSIKLAAGVYFESPVGYGATGAISIFGATTGAAFTAREW